MNINLSFSVLMLWVGQQLLVYALVIWRKLSNVMVLCHVIVNIF